MVRFSEAFKLNKSQAELDFVDIPLHTDIKLFVDPYAISIRKEGWFQECNDLVVSYFQAILDSIRNDSKMRAKYLLSNLSEPNETHLGHCLGASSGCGVGNIQGGDIYKALSKSKAVISGDLSDLSDCALMIEGIGPDKISDITINVTRKKLAEYTKNQCELYGIETVTTSLKPFWNSETGNWENDYYDLPVYEKQPILLCPKLAVRRHMLLDDNDFYQFDILEFLQAEHIDAGSSLVETLKKGSKRVTKKKLQEQEEYKKSKDFIYDFTSEHPEILTRYKNRKGEEGSSNISNDEIESVQEIKIKLDMDKLRHDLISIPPGTTNATAFHNICISILNVVFYPHLSLFKKEQEINSGRKRVDIVATNVSRSNFFFDLAMKHKINVPFIMFECKNYTKDINNPELDQIAGRLCDRRGRMGFVLCRAVDKKDKLLERQKDYLRDENKYIVVLDDIDLLKLLTFKEHNNETELNNFLYSKLNELIL